MPDMWRCSFTNRQILLPVWHSHCSATAASRTATAASRTATAAFRADAIIDG
jgi:hypothetical protein